MTTAVRRGFTLTELMIAIVVMAIAVIGTGAAISTTSKVQRVSSRRAEMSLLALAKLEDFRSRIEANDATTVASLTAPPKGSLTSDVLGYFETANSPNGTAFKIRWTSTAGPALTELITVRVLWPATGTATEQVNLWTYLLVP